MGKTQGDMVKLHVADKQGGKYQLTYMITKADIYELTIFVNGESISVAPYQVLSNASN